MYHCKICGAPVRAEERSAHAGRHYESAIAWLSPDAASLFVPDTPDLGAYDVDADQLLVCRTRTGHKTHLAYPGSAITACGRWMKYAAVHRWTPGGATCRRCRDAGQPQPYRRPLPPWEGRERMARAVG